MRYYLRHQYFTPSDNPSPDDFVGPFDDEQDARDHCSDHGPIRATIVTLDQPPSAAHLVSPEQHIADLKARW